ncbi:MAG: pro-sigmaK processing inhibitor BofA [Firmicutes bacterium]|nr:pro-sigmaK processing inhibitor BofA [Bacillota bacterium]
MLLGVSGLDIVNVLIASIFALFILAVIGKILLKPIKLVFKILFNSVVGVLMLGVINYVGKYIGFDLPINPITALTAGFLGMPGVILLIVLHYLIG